ncbi:exported hypothetical protein [Cupriavidus taiwanensis]|nr:exported hypothetical protein [Cupriavidus taiwanensis]SOY55352.1 exported hypothetical protein [Cupriavidus taiwanensis]SOY89510.1 exported hypothetical protein [Cupriavidus taiwanensis]SOZ61699.1 exported hypothetical protein [Cupriavidus taiwanensis]SOZ81776.1 exported hypothetical protein [Cupriavidus taiwanensis]
MRRTVVFCWQVTMPQYAASPSAPAGLAGQRASAAGVPARAVRRARGGADGKSCGKDNVLARTPVFRRPALLLQRITSGPGVTSGNNTARPIRRVRRPG